MQSLQPTQQPDCGTPPKTDRVAVVRNALRRDRKTLLIVAAVGLAFFSAVAFLIPSYYQSMARLMPPEQQAITSTSTLNALSGQLPAIGGSSLLSSRTPGATSIGILESRTVLDEIISRFDMKHVYGKRFLEQTRAKLLGRTRIEEDRKNGIISITVVDRDPARAQAIANAYIEDLNKLLISVSTSGARREREFLDTRLADVRRSLEDSTRQLSEFTSRNAMLDVQKQGSATLDVAGRLEAQLVNEESESSGMRAIYTNDNVRVRSADARIRQLRSELQKVTGQGEASDETASTEARGFPSIRKLPMLGVTYYALARQVAVKEAIYTTLEKQYELARVQEAKEIPGVKVLDEPDLAERKCYPPRALIALLGMLASVLVAGVWIGGRSLASAQQSA